MKLGAAHVQGLYTVPNGSGTQFTDGADVVEALGLPAFKFYCTQTYAADYPLESAWSGASANCTQFLQTTEVSGVLARAAFTDFAITIFSFGNPATNWWRDAGKADNPRLLIEYTQVYNAAVHLLTTYNNTGKSFVLQNWEGDWALMDGTPPTVPVNTYVKKRDIDYCLAFHSARQRAVRDATRDTAHTNVSVRYAVEVNRVLDVVQNPGRARLLKDVLNRLKPDVVSYSGYDSFTNYGANQTEWESLTTTNYTLALDIIHDFAPDSLLQIGEVGFEEERIAIDRPSYDVGEMVTLMVNLSEQAGAKWFYYWQTFDNEVDGTTPSGTKGYWLAKPNGASSLAATALQALL